MSRLVSPYKDKPKTHTALSGGQGRHTATPFLHLKQDDETAGNVPIKRHSVFVSSEKTTLQYIYIYNKSVNCSGFYIQKSYFEQQVEKRRLESGRLALLSEHLERRGEREPNTCLGPLDGNRNTVFSTEIPRQEKTEFDTRKKYTFSNGTSPFFSPV